MNTSRLFKQFKYQRICILLLASFSFLNNADSQSFLNGNFESNTVSLDQINMTNLAFNAAMANTFAFGSYGDMDIITSSSWGPPQLGTWYVGLTGGGTDIITMKLTAPLAAGTSYTIKFWDRGNAAFPVYPVQLGLSTVNNTIGTAIYTGPTPATGTWTQRSATFIAPNSGQYISVLMVAGSIGDWVNVDNFSFATPLPVELISFSGENINNINHLQWTTSSETNNAYFNIERSRDGFEFEKIEFVKGAGNSTEVLNYNYEDKFPYSGITYYRLQQVDYNGDFSYSMVIAIKNTSHHMPAWIYATGEPGIYILHLGDSKSMSVRIADAWGHTVLTENIDEATSDLILDLRKYPDGIFFISINTGEIVTNLKFINH